MSGRPEANGTKGPLTRRQLLGAAAAGTGSLLLAGSGLGRTWASTTSGGRSAVAAPSTLPAPEAAGIDHIVVVIMENRSFDHFLGWLPGADGRQAGLTYPDRAGCAHPTHHLTDVPGLRLQRPRPLLRGRPRRATTAARATAGCGPAPTTSFSIGYYERVGPGLLRARRAGTGRSATTTSRRSMAPTYPNRFFLHAAQTDRTDDTHDVSTLPTIWDPLAGQGRAANLLLHRRAVHSRCGARNTCRDLASPFATVLDRLRERARCRRCPTSIPASTTRAAERPGTTTRTPTSASARRSSNQVYQAVDLQPALGAHRPRHHLRRVGRLLRPRARRRWRPTPTPDQRAARLPGTDVRDQPARPPR